MKSPVPYFGGKQRMAPWIVSLLPEHDHYVEPFAGSLSVLLAKKPSPMETASDLDGELMTFWRVLRDQPEQLLRACMLTPHSRAELTATWEPTDDDLELARRIWCRLAQGRSGTLRNTGWRHYSTRPARSLRCLATSMPTLVGSRPPPSDCTPCRSRTCPPST
jgi:DNA adenine methylase